ncbi:hypothetical protein [[Limnothrix rosea] IAM M-220]|uniref:hypothetical protein n=1 Tax=[Limnothrix rosea] IAM M-220 TaxID=454133 RepID=UPI00111575A7|nr:hypothetical protein [[Limnothrix rosea] IAM M-220]
MASHLGRWVCAFSIAGSLVSCNPWTAFSQQDDPPPLRVARNGNASIAAIASLKNLEQGTEIRIQGTVAQIAPFIRGGAYKITDSTGSIWVITETSPPASGTKIQVGGQLEFHNLQVESSNFGEIFIAESETFTPTDNEPQLINETKPPKKLNLESYLLPHKENNKK